MLKKMIVFIFFDYDMKIFSNELGTYIYIQSIYISYGRCKIIKISCVLKLNSVFIFFGFYLSSRLPPFLFTFLTIDLGCEKNLQMKFNRSRASNMG